MAKNDAGVPLGGIGAGKIDLCPNGSIKNISSNNNMDNPIVTGHQYTRFQSVSEEGVRGTFGALYVEGAEACILKTKSLGDVEHDYFETLKPNQIRFRGLFPKA
ncbi:MAG: hypothetical protein ONB05_11040 [candidate division KSB1 bacterium]|nr:hypothetical protein [candidate division KSB1 bacterium]